MWSKGVKYVFRLLVCDEEGKMATAREFEELCNCIVMTVAAYAVTPSSGLCCCFSAALQRRVLPLAHNFRLVSPATGVSAHGEQPFFPRWELLLVQSRSLGKRERVRQTEREREWRGGGEQRDGWPQSNSYPLITYISWWDMNCSFALLQPSSQTVTSYCSASLFNCHTYLCKTRDI